MIVAVINGGCCWCGSVVVVAGDCCVVLIALFTSLLLFVSAGIGPNCCSRCCTNSDNCIFWKGIVMF